MALAENIWDNIQIQTHAARFVHPQEMLDAAREYFRWVQQHPLQEEQLVKYQGSASKETVDKMRAMTIMGMCLYFNISTTQWYNYKKKKEFKDLCEQIEQVIYTWKFDGAAAGLLSPNLIVRDLGLADKSELSGPGGKPIENKWEIEFKGADHGKEEDATETEGQDED